MPPEDSSYASGWLRHAETDRLRVTRNLEANDPEAAAFFLQQAMEKFLKAYLIHHGWKLRRIHDLVALLNEAKLKEPAFERFEELCAHVTSYYFLTRYPDVADITFHTDMVRRAYDEAEKLFALVHEQLNLTD